MRVVITGGTGLIGRALAGSLAGDGYEVVVLSRSPDRQGVPLPTGVQVVPWDGRTASGWGDRAEGAVGIVNLAGATIAGRRWTAEQKRRIRESRVNAGHAVTEAIRAADVKPRMLVQASAVGYYGSFRDGGVTLTESSPAGDDFLAGVCRDWEAVTAAVEPLGVRRAVARTGVVLSTEGGALPRMALPFKLFAGGPLGGGRQPLSWIHIADVVGAMRFLIDRPDATGPFNLCAPQPMTNAEFGRAIGRVLRRPAFMPTPAFAMRLAFGEMAQILLEGQRAVPERLSALGFRFRFPAAEAALKDLLGR